MKIEHRIKGLRRIIAQLEEITFVMIPMPSDNNSVKVKFGNKVLMFNNVDKDFAEVIIDDFRNVIIRQIDNAGEIINLLDQKCEQLTLELFEKGEGSAKTEGPGES